MNGGPRTRVFTFQEGVIEVSPFQNRIIEEWLKDGADAGTVARRLGVTRTTINQNLFALQTNLGFENRVELALAIEREQVQVKVKG